MRLAILTDGIFPYVIGGMQKHSFYLAKFLALRGHEITLVHSVPYGTQLPGAEEVKVMLGLEQSNIEVIGLHFPAPGAAPGHYVKESYLYSRNIFRKLKDRWSSFDFIYAKGFTAWHLLHEKSKGYKAAPVGIKFHGYEMFQSTSGLKSKLQSWLLRKPVRWNNEHADHVFSYGGQITTLIRSLGVPDDKIIGIPTGIESDWILNGKLPVRPPVLHFLFIGRYERRKGIEELTRVVQKLAVDEQFHIHFIGPIPPSKKLKSSKVTYHGALSKKEEIQEVMKTCQVLVTPSHSEGMPNVILEGMSRGLSVIATSVGAIPAMVDRRNGWLIEPLSEEQLLGGMKDAIHLPEEQLRQKQSASIERVRSEFTWEEIAVRTEEAISRCVGNRF